MINTKKILLILIIFGVLKPVGLIAGQIVVVHGSLSSKSATLELRDYDGEKEKLVFGPVPAVVGENGIAAVGKKREGDGKTPQGKFKIESAFGYETQAETKLQYAQVTEKDKWIDDIASSQYNQWVRGETNAKSFENLRRKDNLYKYSLVVDYNRKPIVPGAGSAIFAHVWRDANSGTAGCVAISEANMKKLFSLLDKKLNPEILIQAE